MKVSFFVLTALGLFLTSSSASASCMRLVPLHHAGRPDLDGPGSFGPLDGTLTLDCLVFKGMLVSHNIPVALVEDERGKIYKVTAGNYVGENGGRVTEITAERVKIIQLVRDDKGGSVEVPRYLMLGQDNRI